MARKPLAQQVGTTSDVQMYQPAQAVFVTGLELKVNNNTSNDLTFRVFHDIDGTTFAAANAIAYDEDILANTTKVISIPAMDENGALAIRASANTSITFTLYGNEVVDPTLQVLGQRRDNDTSTHTIYSPAGTGILANNLRMIVTNTTGSASTYSIMFDPAGADADEDVAIAWEVPIGANSRTVIPLPPMNSPAGTISVKNTIANSITYTLYGAEV